jgi:hypothetical protein
MVEILLCAVSLEHGKNTGDYRMKVEDAIYHAVHDCEGGAASLAPRMGNLTASTLYSMANPRETAHGWSLARFRQLLAFTGDLRPLNALCEEQHGVFLAVPECDRDAATALQLVANLAADFGDVARSATDSLREGRVSQSELARLDTQILELITAAAKLGKKLRYEAEHRPALKVAK